MSVIPVIVLGPDESVIFNALWDTGADTALVREDLAKRLRLGRKQQNIYISTPNGNSRQNSSEVSFLIKSIDGAKIVNVDGAYTVPSIVDVNVSLPSKQMLDKWSHLSDIDLIPLSDPVVSILIGLDTPEAHWLLEQRRGRKGEPYADRTPFGWVLRGPLDYDRQRQARVFTVCSGYHDIEINLERMYDQEFHDNSSFETAPVADKEAVDIEE